MFCKEPRAHGCIDSTSLATQLALGILSLPSENWNYKRSAILILHIHGGSLSQSSCLSCKQVPPAPVDQLPSPTMITHI